MKLNEYPMFTATKTQCPTLVGDYVKVKPDSGDHYLIPAPVCAAAEAVMQAADALTESYGHPEIEDYCDCATFYPQDCVHEHCKWRKLFEAVAKYREVTKDEV